MSIRDQLAPHGYLRAGINLSNFLLVSGKDDNGIPFGVSPDIAKRVAEELDVGCKLVPFSRPGELADAVNDDLWDIGNIAYELKRADTINFTNPYALIEANFLIRKEIQIKKNKDIDKKGIKIAVADRSAYDLWLTENFHDAEIIRAKSIDESHHLFLEGITNVLAGLKPKLMEEINNRFFLIKDPFTYVKQSIGIKKGNKNVLIFLDQLISKLISEGFIKNLLTRYKVEQKLAVPKN